MRVRSGIMFSSSSSKLMSRGAVALLRDAFDGLERRPAAGAVASGCEIAGLELAMLKGQRQMLTRG